MFRWLLGECSSHSFWWMGPRPKKSFYFENLIQVFLADFSPFRFLPLPVFIIDVVADFFRCFVFRWREIAGTGTGTRDEKEPPFSSGSFTAAARWRKWTFSFTPSCPRWSAVVALSQRSEFESRLTFDFLPPFCSGLHLGYCLGVGPFWAVTAFIKTRSWNTIPSWLCCCSIFWCLWSHSFTWCYTFGATLSFFYWLAPRTSLERLLTIGGSFSPCRQGFNRVWPLSLIGTALKRRYLPLDTRGTQWGDKIPVEVVEEQTYMQQAIFLYTGFTLWVLCVG